MATNYIMQGDVINYTPSKDIKSGGAVVVGNLLGVAITDIASGEEGPVQVEGVFELPKVTASVIGAGESVIWDVSAGKFDNNEATPAAGDLKGGCVAVAPAGNGDETVQVKLNVGANIVHPQA